MATETKKIHLRVYDNSHFKDESEAYNHGQYDTYEDALIAAKAIVDDFFEHNWKIGIRLSDPGVKRVNLKMKIT